MEEFVGSIDFNKNGDLVVSSSYLTYAKWSGFVGCLTSSEVESRFVAGEKPFMAVSALKMYIDVRCGVSNAKWSSDNQILMGTDYGDIILYQLSQINSDASKFELLFCKREHDDLINCLDTKYNENLAISGSQDAKIKIWDLKEQMSINTFQAHSNGITTLSFHSTDKNIFLSGSEDQRALIWDTRNPKPAHLIKHKLTGFPSSSAWSDADSNFLSIGSETGHLTVFDLRMIDQKPFCMARVHDRLIRKLKFKKNTIATASEDCSSKVFSLVNPSVVNEAGLKEIYSYKHVDYVTDIAWHRDERKPVYFTCSWDSIVKSHQVQI